MADVLTEYFSLRNTGHDNDARALIRNTTVLGLQKVKSYSFVQLSLACLLTTSGVATLVVASENIGFPIFNVGPVFTGLLLLLTGTLGFRAAVKGMKLVTPENVVLSSSVRRLIISNFTLSVVTVLIAVVSGIFAFISGAACAGADIYVHIGVGSVNETVNIKEYCHPNRKENSALAFVDGFLCMLVVLWITVGLCLYCRYGSWLGVRRNM